MHVDRLERQEHLDVLRDHRPALVETSTARTRRSVSSSKWAGTSTPTSPTVRRSPVDDTGFAGLLSVEGSAFFVRTLANRGSVSKASFSASPDSFRIRPDQYRNELSFRPFFEQYSVAVVSLRRHAATWCLHWLFVKRIRASSIPQLVGGRRARAADTDVRLGDSSRRYRLRVSSQ